MKFYSVIKINIETEEEINYGTMCEEDMKVITKGYTFDGLFYNRKRSKYFFIVEELEG